MKMWQSLPEVLKIDPDFLKKRGENGWRWNSETGGIESRFGKAMIQVQLKPDGSPDFDRVVYYEPPNINAVVYSFTVDGTCMVGITIQERPFANNPANLEHPYGIPAEPAIKFAQPVMGFARKIFGEKAMSVFESGAGTATREALEELGIRDIIEIKPLGEHYPNPTFCATVSQLFEIQVDLKKILKKTDESELIVSVEFITLKELFSRIGEKV